MAMRLPRPQSRCHIGPASSGCQRIPLPAALGRLAADLGVHVARKLSVAHAELRGVHVVDGNHGDPAVELGADPVAASDESDAAALPSLRLLSWCFRHEILGFGVAPR